ncbi:MAG: glycosyltransferase family 2 protein [Frankiaceae bacterium]|nr:glycosyltransferase family 2 protein [Frankiaceae bacterium]MBV9368514.1 glycosyltransferase family 2 protein [Frankiales bacterium]
MTASTSLPASEAETAPELTILMPCLNEAETLAGCIQEAHSYLDKSGIYGEILIADNGSTDGSQQIAAAAGARVVHVPTRGYGAALNAGIRAAAGRYIVMGDADASYDFGNLDPFVEALRGGADLVMGNRFRGGIEPGAMPPLHRYLGNPVLSYAGRLLFRTHIGDFHCGLRAFRRDRALALNLHTTGMEFASELVVKATLSRQRIVEVPTTLRPDGRSRPPHLRSWRDGWRHLRFLLLFSPRWLFFYPGLAAAVVGLIGMVALGTNTWTPGRGRFSEGMLIASCGLLLSGALATQIAVIARVFAATQDLLPPIHARNSRWLGRHSLELGLVSALVLVVLAVVLLVVSLAISPHSDPLATTATVALRLGTLGVTAGALGVQFGLCSWFLSLVMLPRTAPANVAVSSL